jgi:glycosyl transferase family 25
MIDRILYICLKSSPQRVGFVNQQVERLQPIGIPIEVMPAIEAPTLDCEALRKCGMVLKDEWHDRHLTPGEVACTMSHKEAWRKAQVSDETIMVLEDDCQLGPDWYPRWCQIIKELQLCDHGEIFVVASQHKTWPENRVTVSPNLMISKCESGGTAGYIITPRAAYHLLEETRIIKWATDGHFGNVTRKLTTYVTEPQLGWAVNFPSVIDPFGKRTYRAH